MSESVDDDVVRLALDERLFGEFGVFTLARAGAMASNWTDKSREFRETETQLRAALTGIGNTVQEQGWRDGDELAAAVHAGRFEGGSEPTPFEAEYEQGKRYCRRIARSVIARIDRVPPVERGGE